MTRAKAQRHLLVARFLCACPKFLQAIQHTREAVSHDLAGSGGAIDSVLLIVDGLDLVLQFLLGGSFLCLVQGFLRSHKFCICLFDLLF